MWNEITIPPPPAPIRAYTHANCSVLFICTSSGVFALDLNARTTWEFVAKPISDYMLYAGELVQYNKYGAIIFRETYFPLHGYPTEDSDGCSDIPLGDHPLTGDRLMYDGATDTLLVVDATDSDGVKFAVHPFGVSEDNWATGGFSHDGSFLTVGNLDRILVFNYTRDFPANA